MTMKSIVLLVVLAASVISTVTTDPEWKFQLLDPQGFRLSMENITGLKNSTLTGEIYTAEFGETPSEKYEGELILQSNGWWTYENYTATVNPGDKTLFVIVNFVEGHDVFDLLDDMIMEYYDIPANATRVPA